MTAKESISVGIIGFGLSGKYFHTPLLKALPYFKITKVLSSRGQELSQVLPHATQVSDIDELLDDSEIKLIINCAPNKYHFSYSKKCLEAGKHVVIEKPFVVNSEDGQQLIDLAKSAGLVLTVFHNRRWDHDFLTIKQMIASKKLGDIVLFESHFDRYRPETRQRWREIPGVEGAGIFFDLGAHLLDQALDIFGWPQKLYADLQSQKAQDGVCDYFHVVLYYGRTRVILHGDSFNDTAPRFRLIGTKGTYIKYGMDPQEKQLKDGINPRDSIFGKEDSSEHGLATIYHGEDRDVELIPSESGNYIQFYHELYESLTNNKLPPVLPEQALKVIRLIELSMLSSKEGIVVES